MKRLVVALALLSGCIPMKMKFVMRPEGVVRVVDAKGAPIASARVILLREKYPHRREDARWTVKTDAKGEVSFTREEERQTVFPLMMHGVPGYGFVACAESPGYASKQEAWRVPEEGASPPLVLNLAEGDRRCESKVDLSVPPKGRARVLGIERVDADVWKLDVVLPKDEPVAVGVPLGSLTVTKVEWQSEAINAFRRATVQTRGPGEKVRFGELLVRE